MLRYPQFYKYIFFASIKKKKSKQKKDIISKGANEIKFPSFIS